MPTAGPNGSYWSDARAVLEIDGPGLDRSRQVALDRPFALVGRVADAEIRLDDHEVSSRHAYLHADTRGLFVVDLATRTGTRFGVVAAPAGWLGVGETIEIAGRTIRLASFEIDRRPCHPPPCAENLLTDAEDRSLVGLVLEPLGSRGSSWVIGSELTFAGRGDACGVRLNQADVSRMHAALFRTVEAAYLIDLPGRPTLVNGLPPRGAVALLDGDAVSFGRARFVVRLATTAESTRKPSKVTKEARQNNLSDLGSLTPGYLDSKSAKRTIYFGEPTKFSNDRISSRELVFAPRPSTAAISDLSELPTLDGRPFPIDLVPPEARGAVVGWMLGALHAGQAEILRRQDELQRTMTQILRHIQTRDLDATLDVSPERIDALTAEVAQLNDQAHASAPLNGAEPPAGLNHPTPEPLPAPEVDPARSLASAAWLLERIDSVGNENKFPFRSFLQRLTGRRSPPIVDPEPLGDDPSIQ